jgi:hypothetical protein
MANRALVLDANILIRAVLGNRVRRILEKYADSVSFFIPECARLSRDLLGANGIMDEYPIMRHMCIWKP